MAFRILWPTQGHCVLRTLIQCLLMPLDYPAIDMDSKTV